MDKIKFLKKEFTKLKIEITFLIDNIDTSKNTHLQNYLYFISYPLFSLTESIIILCENNNLCSAEILSRSLIEAHINIIYHQLENSEYKLAVSAKKSFEIKIKNIKELKKLIHKYPDLKSKDPTSLFNEEWLLNTGEWAETYRKKILKGNNLKENDQDLDLKAKAEKCDNLFLDGVEKGHFELMYQIIFRKLSSESHLNIEGIQTFISESETRKYLFSNNDNGDFLSAQAIEICTVFTRDLYKNGVLDGSVTNTVRNIERLIKNIELT